MEPLNLDQIGAGPDWLRQQVPRVPVGPKKSVEVFQRDKWVCEYCHLPVVFHPALRYLQRYVEGRGYKNLAYYQLNFDKLKAPLLDELASTVDHRIPVADGGTNDLDNLVTACNKCNIVKSNLKAGAWETVLAALRGRRVLEKLHHEAIEKSPDWDGFSSLFVVMADDNPAGVNKTDRKWYKALTGKDLLRVAAPKPGGGRSDAP